MNAPSYCMSCGTGRRAPEGWGTCPTCDHSTQRFCEDTDTRLSGLDLTEPKGEK